MSYNYGRRENIINELKNNGYSLAPNGWGSLKEDSLASSSYGLAIHQDELPIIEPLRYMLFAAWKLPIVVYNEEIRDSYPYCFIRNLYDTNNIIQCADENYYQIIVQHPFKKEVEEAV